MKGKKLLMMRTGNKSPDVHLLTSSRTCQKPYEYTWYVGTELFKQKGTVISSKRIMGPDATGETKHITIGTKENILFGKDR